MHTIVKKRAQIGAAGNVRTAMQGLKQDVAETLESTDDSAITNMVTGFIALAIIVGIGIIILSNVEMAMPTVAENSSYYALQETVNSTTASGYGLIVIVLIIVAAAAIMGAVQLINRN